MSFDSAFLNLTPYSSGSFVLVGVIISAVPLHGQNDSVIRHPYITVILRYTQIAKIRPISCKVLDNRTSFNFIMRFVNNLLTNKTIILLDLAEYRLF